MFDEKTNEFVGSGSLMMNGRGVDPDRVILKRIKIDGISSRVHERSMQMFFNAEILRGSNRIANQVWIDRCIRDSSVRMDT